MTEEEKKAICELKNYISRRKLKYTKLDRHDKSIYNLLNLIEKLQKENEELKEYILKAPNLDEMTATKYIIIRQEAYIQGIAEEKQTIYENYIPVQKVEDKIEYLDNQQKQWLEDRELKEGDREIIFARDILKELLGK